MSKRHKYSCHLFYDFVVGVSGGVAITGGLTLSGSVGMLLRGAASGLSIRSGGAYIGMDNISNL